MAGGNDENVFSMRWGGKALCRLRDQYTLGAATAAAAAVAATVYDGRDGGERTDVLRETAWTAVTERSCRRHGRYKRAALGTSPTSCRPIDVFVRNSCLPLSLSNYKYSARYAQNRARRIFVQYARIIVSSPSDPWGPPPPPPLRSSCVLLFFFFIYLFFHIYIYIYLSLLCYSPPIFMYISYYIIYTHTRARAR